MKIGFVGLGIMGRPMALNLVKAGHELVVFNRTRAKCATLEEAGARVAGSPREAAADREIVITIVSDTPDVEEVLFGPDGVAEGAKAGAVVIDMSTISPTRTEEFAARLGEQGVLMLDAPVSGGDKGAIAGTLAIMVGGPAEAFATCLPAFEALGQTVVHVGPSGHGQRTKMVNQVIGAQNIISMVEGMRLLVAAGLDREKAQQVVAGGAAGSWMLTNLAPRVLAGDFAPGFTIELQAKDLRLAAELIEHLGLELPGAALANRVFQQAADQGLGELGTQGIYQLLE